MHPLLKAMFPAALLLATGPVFAHPGHNLGSAGFIAGTLHPLLGLDHLMAMLVVGIWAAQSGGSSRLWVPLSFVVLMTVGATLALNGVVVPQIEAGITASLLILGLLVAMAQRLALPAAMALTGCFAVFHGAAHGSELPILANPAAFATGFLLSTAALHVVGIALGSASLRRLPILVRASGALVVVAGVAYNLA